MQGEYMSFYIGSISAIPGSKELAQGAGPPHSLEALRDAGLGAAPGSAPGGLAALDGAAGAGPRLEANGDGAGVGEDGTILGQAAAPLASAGAAAAEELDMTIASASPPRAVRAFGLGEPAVLGAAPETAGEGAEEAQEVVFVAAAADHACTSPAPEADSWAPGALLSPQVGGAAKADEDAVAGSAPAVPAALLGGAGGAPVGPLGAADDASAGTRPGSPAGSQDGSPRAESMAMVGSPAQADAIFQSSASYFGPYVRPAEDDPGVGQRAAGADGLLASTRNSASHRPSARPGAAAVPFAEPRGAAAARKLAGVQGEVQALQVRVREIAGGAKCRFADLRQVQQDAEALRRRLCMSEEALAQVGWPAAVLRHIDAACELVAEWDRALEEARSQLAAPASTASSVRLLEKILTAWAGLKVPHPELAGLDLGMEQRARTAAALVSAVVDRLVTEGEDVNDRAAFRRFLTLVHTPVTRHVLESEIGAELPQEQFMEALAPRRRLSQGARASDARVGDVPSPGAGAAAAPWGVRAVRFEQDAPGPPSAGASAAPRPAGGGPGGYASDARAPIAATAATAESAGARGGAAAAPVAQAAPAPRSVAVFPGPPGAAAPGAAPHAAGGARGPVAPDALLQAVGAGDLQAARACLQQAPLRSGRACDANGRSVFWHAVAHELPEVALAIFKQFPPQAHDGVDACEVHPKRGDTLLHLVCGRKRFDGLVAELFTNLLEAIPESLQACANSAGETFFHIAAAHSNCWLLSHAATTRPNSVKLCLHKDAEGRTPLAVLAGRLEARGSALTPPPPPVAAPDEPPMPDWGRLGGLRPATAAPGAEPPPFADVEVSVEDATSGCCVRTWGHRVVLAAASPQWREELNRQTVVPAVLRISPQHCRSHAVLAEALSFVYSGGVLREQLASDLHLLWQLLCFSVHCALPEALRRASAAMLLEGLARPDGAPVVPVLLRGARAVRLNEAERSYVLHRFLHLPDAAAASGPEPKFCQAFKAALSELELVLSRTKHS